MSKTTNKNQTIKETTIDPSSEHEAATDWARGQQEYLLEKARERARLRKLGFYPTINGQYMEVRR